MTFGNELDLTDNQRFLKSCATTRNASWCKTSRSWLTVPTNDFHWEIEVPEVFFGFPDVNQRQVQHKDEIQKGSAGFDCVIGNPPYDVMEKLRWR